MKNTKLGIGDYTESVTDRYRRQGKVIDTGDKVGL